MESWAPSPCCCPPPHILFCSLLSPALHIPLVCCSLLPSPCNKLSHYFEGHKYESRSHFTANHVLGNMCMLQRLLEASCHQADKGELCAGLTGMMLVGEALHRYTIYKLASAKHQDSTDEE